MRLVYSVRSAEDVIYADELDDDALLTFTRRAARGLDRPHRAHRRHTDRRGGHRVRASPSSAAPTASSSPRRLLLEAGFAPERIRTERFGPTG